MIKFYNDKKTTKIELFGTIGEDFWSEGWTLDRFKAELKGIETPEVEIEIKSLGGDVLEAFGIRDAITTLPMKITTKIVGSTASAGTIISTAGDTREITENSRFLIHNASTITLGNADEHEKSIEMLKSIDEQIVNIYHQVTGQRKSRLKALMNEEKWITAQEAKEWGFVDKITKNKVLNEKQEQMNEDLMKLLKVDNETDLLKTVNKLIEESEAKDTTIAELENKVKDFEVAAKQTEAEMINEFLDSAVKDGKIKEAAKEKWFAQAEKDFGLVKETITSIETIEAGVENFIEATVGDDVKLTPEEKFYKNHREGKYEKDPGAYAKDYSAAFGE